MSEPTGSYLDEKIKCPHCGEVEALNDFDVGGADEGCAFCSHCHREFVLANAEGADDA